MLPQMPALRRQRRGFTLVEILIVVVILGILASIVVPQFASATNEAVKSHLARNLQAIDHNIALYVAQHPETLPTTDPDDPMAEGGNQFGWGVMVSENYLSEAPTNFYTSSKLLLAGTVADALAATSDAANGWFFEVQDRSVFVYAAGYDRLGETLTHERQP